MKRYPPKVADALTHHLIDRAQPLVISIDAGRQVREVQGNAAHYGLATDQLAPILELVSNMQVGADCSQPLLWPLVAIDSGHHVALHWIPDQPFNHVVLTDSDLCNAELTERQQQANESALASIEKSRTIRELKSVRKQLESRERSLLETQQFQQRLIDTLAHDLRTPLTSISGYAALLEPHLKNNTPLHRALGAIQRNAVYLKSLAENLLELARQGRPDAQVERHAFALEDLADDIELIIRPMADGKGLALKVSAQSSGTRMPFFDQIRLHQILVNLLSNAVRYTQAGEVRAELSWDGEGIDLLVTDTGIGIAPEYQQSIFEPLNRGAQQGREGAGLGLSIVRQLVESMDGEIKLSSVPGMGTRVHVHLPEQTQEPTPIVLLPSGDEPALNLSNRKVLIVDDDPDICELLQWSLRELGYDTETLQDAARLHARTVAFDPALIIIDVDLGTRSGLLLTQELRLKEYDGAIIVFSGASDARTRSAAEKAGANGFLAKPLDMRRFLRWMQQSLDAVPV